MRYTSEWYPPSTFFHMREVDSFRTDSIKAYLNFYPSGWHAAPPATDEFEPRPFTWSGFYLGVNAGGTGGKNEFFEPQGGSLGGQLGWGISATAGMYLGIEAALRYGNVTGSKSQFGVTEQLSERGTASILAQVGCCDFGRPTPLVYVTAGRTWTRSEFSIHGMGFHEVDTQVLSGWTVGVGVQMPLTAQLSLGVQYLSTWYEPKAYFDDSVEPGSTRTDYLGIRLNYLLAQR